MRFSYALCNHTVARKGFILDDYCGGGQIAIFILDNTIDSWRHENGSGAKHCLFFRPLVCIVRDQTLSPHSLQVRSPSDRQLTSALCCQLSHSRQTHFHLHWQRPHTLQSGKRPSDLFNCSLWLSFEAIKVMNTCVRIFGPTRANCVSCRLVRSMESHRYQARDISDTPVSAYGRKRSGLPSHLQWYPSSPNFGSALWYKNGRANQIVHMSHFQEQSAKMQSHPTSFLVQNIKDLRQDFWWLANAPKINRNICIST